MAFTAEEFVFLTVAPLMAACLHFVLLQGIYF